MKEYLLEDEEDTEYDLYASLPKIKKLCKEEVLHFLTKANCKNADRMDVSISQQH